MHNDLCFCDQIPLLNYETRLTLVIHSKELKRSTNTGRLAVKALENSEMKVRGLSRAEALDLSDVIKPEYENLLLYPSEDAIELSSGYIESLSKNVNLIVPDGNWRQASKVNSRHPEIAHLQRVTINDKNMETEFLRRESTENGMATLQAISCAMKIIESEEAGEELMKLYRHKLNRTLIARGSKSRKFLDQS